MGTFTINFTISWPKQFEVTSPTTYGIYTLIHTMSFRISRTSSNSSIWCFILTSI